MKKLSASATITTVLILGSIAALISSFMLLTTTDNVILYRVLREGKQAEFAAQSCGEVALAKLRTSGSYAGNETIQLEVGLTCQIDVVIENAGTYTLTTHATVGESTKHMQITVSSRTQYVTASEWIEIVQ